MARDLYRCGPAACLNKCRDPLPDGRCPHLRGCGHEFEVAVGEPPLGECPVCEAVFCGAECCGNEAEFVRHDDERPSHSAQCFGPWLSVPGVEQPVRFMATQELISSTGQCPRFRCSECKVEYDMPPPKVEGADSD